MKKLLFLLCTVTFFSFWVTAQNTITDAERKDAIGFYKDAAQKLEMQVKGLSEAQLNWKSNDSTWSVSECLEHIAVSEKFIFDWAMSSLKSAAEVDKKSDKSDDEVKNMVESRERKVKTFDALKPKKQFSNAGQTLATFKQRREDNIKYIETTTDDLRHHFAQTPLGTLDTYQLLLFLNAHTIRHTAQLIEVKSMAGFPKK